MDYIAEHAGDIKKENVRDVAITKKRHGVVYVVVVLRKITIPVQTVRSLPT